MVSFGLMFRNDFAPTHPGKVGVDVPADVVRAPRVCQRHPHHRGTVASEARDEYIHTFPDKGRVVEGRCGESARAGTCCSQAQVVGYRVCQIEPQVHGERLGELTKEEGEGRVIAEWSSV